MKKSELLALNLDKQVSWLKKNLPDFLEMAHGADDIGEVIPFIDSDLDDYINYPESYDTGLMIKGIDEKMSDKRAEEINLGAPLTKSERDCLEESHIDNIFEGSEGGVLVCTGYKIPCENEEVYVAFEGYLAGQASYQPSLVGIFPSQEDAINHFSKNKYYYPGTNTRWDKIND